VDLAAKLRDPARAVSLYGTTPPRADAGDAAVRVAAERLAERLRALPLDGLVVYDIQDESGRTAAPRPFAFAGTIDPRVYARLLARCTGLGTITYKSLGTMDDAAWRAWLAESDAAYGVSLLSVVGRPTSGVAHALPLARAIRIAAEHAGRFTVGGVVIAERHTVQRSEAARMLAKSLEGCAYFISQTVYHAQATTRLLRDYLRDCRGAGAAPRRVVLTFSPVGRERTLAFLRWLGVRVPEETAREILQAARPLERSIAICRDNLRRILDSAGAGTVPLGVNVESVSINRDEIEASIELFHALREVLAERRAG
jgi:hypothetical protein